MEETASREVMWNISHSLTWVMYLLFLVALGFCVYFLVKRWRLMSIGTPVDRTSNWKARAKGMIVDALLQLRVLKKPGAGIMHLGMYVGMIIMLIATAVTAAQFDLGIQLLYGDFYLYFMSLVVDLAGLAFCIAMVACIIRRIVNKKLDTKPGDIIVLVLLLVIGMSGFVVEGLRIVGTDDPWRAWSPIGNMVSMLFVNFSQDQIQLTHQIIWWSHMGMAFALIAYWMYSKLVHVLLMPADVWCRSLEPKGTLPYIDVEDENLTTMGVRVLEDFTWKDLLDAEACIRCGRCEDVCPAFNTDKALSPKDLIQSMRSELEVRGPIVWKAKHDGAKRDDMGAYVTAEGEPYPFSDEQPVTLDRTLVGDAFNSQALWDCTTCGACMAACPTLVEHTPKIVKMRTYQVSMESAFPPEAQATFRNLENNGNPWGLGWQTRSKWAEELDVPTLAENPDAEYLYWPGCSGAFDARSRKVSVALVGLLKKAGVNFAILGNEEKCCGDSARRMGNEFVYYMLASENIATLQSYGVKKIIVQCPHCMQTLSRDYPQLGGNFEVIHHSQLLAQLVREGKLQCAASGDKKIAVHDSCYLGRYQDEYEAPRAVVSAAGGEVVEFERSHEKSFCCGAGGGRMWLEDKSGKRMGDERAKQALATSCDEVATSCPFCLTMLSDGMAACESETKVRDIAEILAQVQ